MRDGVLNAVVNYFARLRQRRFFLQKFAQFIAQQFLVVGEIKVHVKVFRIKEEAALRPDCRAPDQRPYHR